MGLDGIRALVLGGGTPASGPGSGSVVGPATSTANAVATFSGTGGQTLLDNPLVTTTGGVLSLASTGTVNWASTAASPGTPDVGIKRPSAGFIQLTDGSTGLGSARLATLLFNSGFSGDIQISPRNAGVVGIHVAQTMTMNLATQYAFATSQNVAPDVGIGRSAAAVLSVTNGSTGSGSLLTLGLQVKEGGAADRMGTLTLNGSTEVTVSTTAVTASSRIFLTVNAPAGTPAGIAYVSSRSAGTSFGVKGNATDTSTVAWMIVEPG